MDAKTVELEPVESMTKPLELPLAGGIIFHLLLLLI